MLFGEEPQPGVFRLTGILQMLEYVSLARFTGPPYLAIKFAYKNMYPTTGMKGGKSKWPFLFGLRARSRSR